MIFLGILNFKFTSDPHYLSSHCIYNVNTREPLLQDFRFTFAELPKFNKTESELITVEDKWLYFLKYAKEITAIPAVIHEAAIREAFEIVNMLLWDREALHQYEQRSMSVQIDINRQLYGYKKSVAFRADIIRVTSLPYASLLFCMHIALYFEDRIIR